MSAQERTQASVECADCDEARRRSSSGPIVCTCGTVFADCDDLRLPRETPEPTTGVRPRLGLDAPVGTVPEPTRPPPRLERESEAVARAARLLAELRPHGPGAREPLDGAQEGRGASLAPRAGGRAPWDVDAPRGAFQRDAAGEVVGAVVARIARVAAARERACLAWLRRSGTLAFGPGPMAVSLAWAVAGPELTASWAGDAAHGRDRARAWGALRLDEACAAWEAAW